MDRQAQRDIFAITGLPPEVLAVAMAKYSRSPESIRDTIDDLTEEKSAEFHEKWVLGYGDASVADMAVVAIACENVSILASKAIEDSRLASYQEKSTRYVEFDATCYHRPPAIMIHYGELYEHTADNLFTVYRSLLAKTIEYMRGRFPKPEDVTPKAYEAKLKARSLDGVRYLLPVATLTNFGMIMSARSLRHMISKLRGSQYQEIRAIGERLKAAATEPAYNPQRKKLQPILDKLRDGGIGADLVDAIEKLSALQIKGAPTLIKYTDPPTYLKDSQDYLKTTVRELLRGIDPDHDSPRVDYIEPHAPEDELVSTLLYSVAPHSYRQILEVVQKLPTEQKQKIISAVAEKRGAHDQPRREYELGGFIFDVLMDYGAFRDLQRHRMCTQINQPLTMEHGFEMPWEIEAAGLTEPFHKAMATARDVYEVIRKDVGVEADYLISLAYKKRTLFKMNLRELYHMVELRSKPGGHMSYRKIVLDMYEAVKKNHPALVQGLRAVIPNYDEDFFKR